MGVSKYGEFTVEVKTQEKEEWSLRQEIQVTKEVTEIYNQLYIFIHLHISHLTQDVQESWQVVHFHVQEWSTDSKLLPVHWVELIESVKRSTDGKGPVVVHCRFVTFCLWSSPVCLCS